MSQRKERALVICPGRGTYNASEWGYLQRFHQDKSDLIQGLDAYRRDQQQPTLTELDNEHPYSLKLHSRGDHASPLIYGCSMCDALDINTDRFDIVAVTGNSMGWYTALAVAGALQAGEGMHLVNRMGSLMHQQLIGGQLIYPWVDEHWRILPDQREQALNTLNEVNQSGQGLLYLSIDLGGILVFGGDEPGLTALAKALPARDRFPMRLYNHAAFHTPLQQPVRELARQQLSNLPLQQPGIPLIDGRGSIWSPWSTDHRALWDYTLGHQLTEAYHFTRAIIVGLREFAPDKLIITGPGTTLGGAVAQCLIQANWQDIESKEDFIKRQQEDPIVISMGRDDQRALAL